MTKFERSQRAHLRLVKFHDEKRNNEKNKRLCGYHYEIYGRQESRGSVLSKKDKREIYKGWMKTN